mgnify:FL=1
MTLSLPDILLLAAVAVGVYFAIRSLVRPKHGCHGGCDHCSSACHNRK